jgi:molybdate transport system permease protein
MTVAGPRVEQPRGSTTRRRANMNRAPAWLVLIAGLGASMFAAPLVALAWRAPWSSLVDHLRDPAVRTALRLSLVCSLSATMLSAVFGFPLAWILARTTFPGKRVLRALIVLPMVLPPVVGGLALLMAFGRNGVVGQWLDDWFGIRLAFTTAGVVLAETFVGMPFFVVTVEAALRSVDPELEDAARTLRAGRWTVVRTITLPLIRSSLVAGAVLCWARALGEFGATITFAGNRPGVTETIPLRVYLALETDAGSAIVLGLILMAVSLGVLIALHERWLGG